MEFDDLSTLTDNINTKSSRTIFDQPNRIVNSKGVPGTLGCIAYLRESGEPVILSNWHIIFGKNAAVNDKVWQVEENEQSLTELGKVIAGKIGNIWFHNWEFFIDCAISTISSPKITVSLPQITGHAEARAGEKVYKAGAATGLTKGTIMDVQYANQAIVDGHIITAKNQLLIHSDNRTPFSINGDSGAAVLNENHEAVGLLWGVSPNGDGIASPILPIMHQLDIVFETLKLRL